MGHEILVLSAKEIRSLISIGEIIDAVRGAYLEQSAGVIAPGRMHIDIPENKGTILIMPVYSSSGGYMSLKTATLFSGNRDKNLPLLQAVITLIDGSDGRILALMDGSLITALRTGAASGVASGILARDDSKTVAVFGAGIQGRTQLEAVCAVREIEQAFIFDPHESSADKFAEEMAKMLGIDVKRARDENELRKADIICTATSSSDPVFKAEFISPGTHINAIGSYKPHIREIPGEIVARSRIVMDHKESCLSEAGDLLIPLKEKLIDRERLQDEISEIITGNKPGRVSNDVITFFKSVGHAVQDLASARLIYDKALETGKGRMISL
jgi:ornithine cyclodeaminase/alanine dehydrogenase-like protein (mu-crystallin family)